MEQSLLLNTPINKNKPKSTTNTNLNNNNTSNINNHLINHFNTYN